MRLRHEGKPLLLEKSALAQRLPNASGKLLVHSMGGLVSRSATLPNKLAWLGYTS